MSSQTSTQLNNLIREFQTISNQGLTNPLLTPLNANSFNVTNLNNLFSTNGLDFNINSNTNINLKAPTNITNDSIEDGLTVSSSTSPLSVVKVDKDNNLGVGVTPNQSLVDKFTCVGNGYFSGSLFCNELQYNSLNPPIPATMGPTGPMGPTGSQAPLPTLTQVLSAGNNGGGYNISNLNNVSVKQLNYQSLNPPISTPSTPAYASVCGFPSANVTSNRVSWVGIPSFSYNKSNFVLQNFTLSSSVSGTDDQLVCNEAGFYLINYSVSFKVVSNGTYYTPESIVYVDSNPNINSFSKSGVIYNLTSVYNNVLTNSGSCVVNLSSGSVVELYTQGALSDITGNSANISIVRIA
jgi:hypothetical protein